VLASETDPFDPMEKAFKELGNLYLDQADMERRKLVHEYSLSPELLALSHAISARVKDCSCLDKNFWLTLPDKN
jgi:hypothetical protein